VTVSLQQHEIIMKKLICVAALLIAFSNLSRSDEPAKTNKTEEPKKPSVYDEKANAKELIDSALVSAKRENRRVLIQWGGNWCSWCLLLHERFRSDKVLAKTLRYEYDVVHIDSRNNGELMKKYGADKNDGVPYLTILDGDGKLLINQSTVPFETKEDGKNGHDPKKIQEFLEANKAPPLKADSVVEAALAEANKSNRVVFLHFGAPWCGWCLKLDAWLARPEIAKVFGKEFVETKIDMDRMTGAKEVLSRFNPSESGGIPWFVILDGKGKSIATSDGPKGNIGFPATDEEIAHFVKMMEASKKHLSASDIEFLKTSLTPKKKVTSDK
jgi:thioredoxin-related protein